ncbi:MAG TPA: class I SAM-dependent methyltransferase [Candidatus Acidoferrum sp.]|nr:class I SAM-dependent methyltransferase [Candidatus Acidoferrum sp.]
METIRWGDAVQTVSTVWRRAFLDAVIAPKRFRRVMPELRRVSDMLVHPGVGTMSAFSIPPPQEPLRILGLDSGYGGMPSQDLCALLRVARWIAPRRIFEIGTFQGATTAQLAANTDADICTLDLPREMAAGLDRYIPKEAALLQSKDSIGRLYRGHGQDCRIHQLWGDSRTFDYAPYRHSMDLVLVDACHLYDYVLSDSAKAFELLGDTGTILWHDFGNAQDVTRAVVELGRCWPIYHLEGTWLALYVRGVSCAEPLPVVDGRAVAVAAGGRA